MVNMKFKIFLALTASILSASQSLAFKDCAGHPITWDNCFRRYSDANGNTYTGEFRNGTYDGRGQ